MYDSANLLFSGSCNARCYFCIGHQLSPALSPNNLNDFPPRNLESFIIWICQHEIRQLVFSGTNTDPQLYQFEARLLADLRERLPSATQFSLHTNGRLALRKIHVFNRYDRVAISLPSFDPATYHQMMGVPGPPDLPEILRQAKIPVKVSCLVTTENALEIPQFLTRCWELGIQRVVLRKPFGQHSPWEQIVPIHGLTLFPRDEYRANPVFDFHGMEVTLWDFNRTTSQSVNLFASGLISQSYRLMETDGD
jgi:molybdenum cofactor biosynthesis enzyme MoaA